MDCTSLLNGTKDTTMGIRDSIGHVFPNLYFFAHRKYIDARFHATKDPKKKAIKEYKKRFKLDLNIDNPHTFYEKVNYLKFNYTNANSGVMVDKYLVKDFLIKKGYSQYIVKAIARYLSFKDFKKDFDKIVASHKQFVVKLAHTSGDVFFFDDGKWRDKKGKKVSKRFVFACLRHNIKQNYYHHNFEKDYDTLDGSILIEEYISSFQESGMDEYKFFCNNGEIKMINVVYGRQTGDEVREAFTDASLKIFDTWQDNKVLKQEDIYIPNCFEKMVKFSKDVSKSFPMIRVDLLTNGNQLYFCEFTFYDCAGMNVFYPLEKNYEIGSLFNIEDIIYERI